MDLVVCSVYLVWKILLCASESPSVTIKPVDGAEISLLRQDWLPAKLKAHSLKRCREHVHLRTSRCLRASVLPPSAVSSRCAGRWAQKWQGLLSQAFRPYVPGLCREIVLLHAGNCPVPAYCPPVIVSAIDGTKMDVPPARPAMHRAQSLIAQAVPRKVYYSEAVFVPVPAYCPPASYPLMPRGDGRPFGKANHPLT